MDQRYSLHHVCIYDENPREHMWPWLRWYHAIPQYYWGGDEFHLTDEGHVDYTFLACGSPFQVQLESPPYQFEYERTWHAEHGSGYNHICWIVPDALATVDYLRSHGCEDRMPYEEFGVYRGFVCADPEGRWIEIMEYIGDFKTPDVEFRPVGIPGLAIEGVTQYVDDLPAMTRWYCDVLGLRVERGSVDDGEVFLVDVDHGGDRRIGMRLASAVTGAECEVVDRHGPSIGAIDYRAIDLVRADADAELAGFTRVSDLSVDARSGEVSSSFLEPSGNLISLRPMRVAQ